MPIDLAHTGCQGGWNMQKGTCKLCRNESELLHSHVIPAFVMRWLKETSPARIRDNSNPNRRVQDGPKLYWLCRECEQLFSSFEGPFKEQIFDYVHTTSTEQHAVKYGPWALKFAASIAWRSLHFCLDTDHSHLDEQDVVDVLAAEAVWRGFLLGERPHPGRHDMHFIPLDTLASSTGGKNSRYLNRYFLRAVQTDLITSPKLTATITKLGRVVIIGRIRYARRADFEGTQLHVKEGTVCGRDLRIPAPLGAYWNEKADTMGTAGSSLSDKQRARIEADLKKGSPEELLGAEFFRAMLADISQEGKAGTGE